MTVLAWLGLVFALLVAVGIGYSVRDWWRKGGE